MEDIGNEIWKVFYRNVILDFFNENELRTKEKSLSLETYLVYSLIFTFVNYLS